MKKETIVKYEKEFISWCKGKPILMGFQTAIDNKTLTWRPVKDFNDWNDWNALDTIFILDNEYAIFAKALAEGKTIQINNSKPETWIDIDTDKLANYNPSFLRIKPDESKFKVGDFVRYAYSTPARALEINNINGDRYYFTNSEMSCVEHKLEPWTPVKDEWCWFFNDDRIPTISKFVEINEDIARKYFAVYPNRPHALGSWYKKCEPFLNSLPSYLKDK